MSDPPHKVRDKRWSDWLFLDLEDKPVPDEPARDLFLTINFSADWFKLLAGRVRFGLSAGDLRLSLDSGRIPYATREPSSQLADVILAKRKHTRRKSLEDSTEATLGARVSIGPESPGLSVSGEVKGTESGTDSTEISDEFEHRVAQVRIKGEEDTPAWRFETATGEAILEGSLIDYRLGRVLTDPEQAPGGIEALFEIAAPDIQILKTEGLWPDSIARNKRAVLSLIIRKWLWRKMQPVSRVKLR